MPARPPDPESREPGDFARLLATRDPLVLVGGQAVNLWALHYSGRTREFVPFVSRDVDVLGDRDTLKEIGRIAGAKPQFFSMKQPTNEVGVVIARDHEGSPLLIQVLRGVRGVLNEELQDPAYTMRIAGVSVIVPGPIALLKAKIANVASINQAGRQDGRHVAILCRLIPAYLEDLRTTIESGRVEEKVLIELAEKLLRVITRPEAKRVLKLLGISPADLFRELKPGKLDRLRSFLEKRLPRAKLG